MTPTRLAPKTPPPRHGHLEDQDPAPDMRPVEPDQGLVQPHIPPDPEHDRVIDPEA